MFDWLFKKKKKIEEDNSLEYGEVSLLDLINLRDAFYHDTTQQIFKVIEHNVIAATKEVLDVDTSEHTEWVSVEIVPPDHLAMLGVCTYPIGCHISDDTVDVVIDGENQESYKRLIKLGMPIKLAEDGNVKDLVEYMKKHSDGSLPFKQPDQYSKVVPSDFSFDELTPEQQEQLKHFSHHSKDKVN